MNPRAFLLLIAAVLIFGTALTLLAASTRIELPPEPVALKQNPGAELVQAQCLTCHSVEYITTQPPLPRKYWKSAVEKMQTKFGAPIPPEQVEALADYLALNYGSDSLQ